MFVWIEIIKVKNIVEIFWNELGLKLCWIIVEYSDLLFGCKMLKMDKGDDKVIDVFYNKIF